MHHISISKAILAVIYLFKVEMQTPNNGKFVESQQEKLRTTSILFIVNFEQVSHIVLVFPLSTWNK